MDGSNPEIARRVVAAGIATNYHDVGPEDGGPEDGGAPAGDPILLIHGSGPGVSAWANWRPVLPRLAGRFRLIAPDMAGFGFSDRPAALRCDPGLWVDQLLGLLDALALPRVHVVGNSFGGAIALALAIRQPQRVNRLALMGSVGVPFPITPGLEAVWGYTPSLAAMRGLLDIFAHDRGLVTDELAELRYRASTRPGFQEAFAALFPAPRQRWVDALASPEAAVRALPHPALVLHGRDDRVIPLATSLTLHQWLDRSQLHVFGRCGHWVQIEQTARFCRLLGEFFAEPDG